MQKARTRKKVADFADLWKGTSFGNPADYPEVGRYQVSLFGPSEYQYRLLPPHIEEAMHRLSVTGNGKLASDVVREWSRNDGLR